MLHKISPRKILSNFAAYVIILRRRLAHPPSVARGASETPRKQGLSAVRISRQTRYVEFHSHPLQCSQFSQDIRFYYPRELCSHPRRCVVVHLNSATDSVCGLKCDQKPHSGGVSSPHILECWLPVSSLSNVLCSWSHKSSLQGGEGARKRSKKSPTTRMMMTMARECRIPSHREHCSGSWVSLGCAVSSHGEHE